MPDRLSVSVTAQWHWMAWRNNVGETRPSPRDLCEGKKLANASDTLGDRLRQAIVLPWIGLIDIYLPRLIIRSRDRLNSVLSLTDALLANFEPFRFLLIKEQQHRRLWC